MNDLLQISGRDCVKALGKVGFYVKNQQGSHVILRRDEPLPRWLYPTIRCWIEVRCGQLSAKPA
jgi:hypothetical protein